MLQTHEFLFLKAEDSYILLVRLHLHCQRSNTYNYQVPKLQNDNLFIKVK